MYAGKAVRSHRGGTWHRTLVMLSAGLFACGILGGGLRPLHAEPDDSPEEASAPEASHATPDDATDLATPEHTLSGEFVSYSAEAQEVTIVDENDEELVFTVDPGVQPRAGGTTLPFDELRAGDQLTLTVVDAEDGTERVTAIDATRAPAKSPNPAA